MNSGVPATMDETTQTGQLAVAKRAIVSVSDKTGLAEFATQLADLGIEIYSTGGTARHLFEAGIPVKDVAEYTAFPEMMDGRVKTLHPKIFGGILYRRDNPQDVDSISQHGILPFDLVVVNLYPFAETVAREDCTRSMAIENIDIGGPSLVRAAAKNCKHVAIATSPTQYSAIIRELKEHGGTTQTLRNRLMSEAFRHTSEYDTMIAGYFAATKENEGDEETLPDSISLQLNRKAKLRYGENSHQLAGLYEIAGEPGTSLTRMEQLHGKELSFNNLLDVNNGLNMISSFDKPACVVIKHNNPCGAATGESLVDVVDRAFQGDPVSAFGSIVASNQPIDAATARFLADRNFFIEAIVCPGFEPEAFDILTTRPRWKKNVRLLKCPLVQSGHARLDMRKVHGGMLVQQADDLNVDSSDWKIATDHQLDQSMTADLAFVWNMVRYVKSNAIVLGKNLSLCGVGAGQMSRVDAVRIAIEKAGDRAAGCVLASDAFFPFPDSVEIAAKAGIVALIQPGGSVKDGEVIAACQQHNLPMVLTGRRHFLH